MVQSHGFPTVMCRRDHWCCIILRKCYNKVAISTITIPNTHFICTVLPTGLRQKHKAPEQVLIYRSAMHSSIYIALGTRLCVDILSIQYLHGLKNSAVCHELS